jgi:hypothetical protein
MRRAKWIHLPELTQEQKSAITGSLLGDGCIVQPHAGNNLFVKVQCDRRKEYLDWHYDLLHPYSSNVSLRWNKTLSHDKNGKPYIKEDEHTVRKSWSLVSKAHPCFTDLRKKWYSNKRKIIPIDIQLDVLSLAIWYCDDGQNVPTKRCAYFHTDSFSEEECVFLIEVIKNTFDINCSLSFHRGKPKVRVMNKSYLDFITLVKPHVIWNCFQYKVDISKCYELKGRATKLKENDVKEIIGLYYNERLSQEAIGEKFDVASSTISKIIRGTRWRDIERPFYTGLKSNNKTGYSGVSWDKESGKWVASIYKHGKRTKLGRFVDIDQAILARKEAERCRQSI